MLEWLESIVTLADSRLEEVSSKYYCAVSLENFVLWAEIPEEDSDCVP